MSCKSWGFLDICGAMLHSSVHKGIQEIIIRKRRFRLWFSFPKRMHLSGKGRRKIAHERLCSYMSYYSTRIFSMLALLSCPVGEQIKSTTYVLNRIFGFRA